VTDTWLDPDLLNSLFDYKNGKLYRKFNPSKDKRYNRRVGQEVIGSADAQGYLRVSVHHPIMGKKNQRIHRVVFSMINGWCPEILDHENGIVSDNRIENLRPANAVQNSCNKKLSIRSSTGVEGVRLRHNGRYQVYIQFDNKAYYNGHYETLEEAAAASLALRVKLRGQWHRDGGPHY
jgi:hypothetical protein